MFDFPILELMDDGACLAWLERELHPDGWRCPRSGSQSRREFRMYQAFPRYRCRDCKRPYSVVTGTAFEKTRQRPARVVLLLRGVAQGVSRAQFSRELNLSYNQALTLRQRLQDNANETAPESQMEGKQFESDELYQNAGEKRRRPSNSPRPAAATREQATRTRHL